jgi:hypothetical protein
MASSKESELAVNPSKLEERTQWTVFEKKMINLAKGYGKVADALYDEEEPEFVVVAGTAAKGTFEQLVDVEKAKITLKEEADYKYDKRKFTGLLVGLLGSTMEAALRAEESFEAWYHDDNYLKIWIKLKEMCVKSVMADLDEKKYGFWRIIQGERSLDEFVLEIEYTLGVLRENKCTIEEEDAVLVFIMGLDEKRYKEFVAEIRSRRGTPEYPDSFVKIKEMAKIWGSLRGLNACRREARRSETAMEVQAHGKYTCNRCGGDHQTRECTVANSDLKCSNCGKKGHLEGVCWRKKKFAHCITIG